MCALLRHLMIHILRSFDVISQLILNQVIQTFLCSLVKHHSYPNMYHICHYHHILTTILDCPLISLFLA